MPTIIAPDRQQITFLNKLNDTVVPDHPVRLIDALIDKIIAQDPEFFDHLAPQPSVGRRGYSAAALSDTGYADLGDIQRIQKEGTIRCYVPENDAPTANRVISFDYIPETDSFECSQGRPLVAVGKGIYKKIKHAYMDRYRGSECCGCRVADECTTANDGVRTLTVFHGAEWRKEYKRQLASRYGRERIAEGKTLVEHPFGTLRYWMGQIPLKLRGLKKVQTEINLYTAGYNIKRWSGLATFEELLEQVNGWSAGNLLQTG